MEPGQGRQFGELYLEQSRDIKCPLLPDADVQRSTKMSWGMGGSHYHFGMAFSISAWRQRPRSPAPETCLLVPQSTNGEKRCLPHTELAPPTSLGAPPM